MQLQGILEDIALATSYEVALLLAKNLAGVEISIPKEPKKEHALCKQIGLANVQLLANKFGYGKISIPNGKEQEHKAKRRTIEKMLYDGYNIRDIALLNDCCERTVYNIKKRAMIEEDSKQYTMLNDLGN